MSSDPRLVVKNSAHLEPHPIDSDRVGGFITVNLF